MVRGQTKEKSLMDGVHQFEGSILIRVMQPQWKFGRIFRVVVVQTVLLVVIYQLLFHAKLGQLPDLILLSEALLILILAPYLACQTLNQYVELTRSANLLRLSPLSHLRIWGSFILVSQVYTLCFVGFSTLILSIFIPQISDISFRQVILLHLVFGIYIFVGAAVGGFFWHVFRDALFATEMTYIVWGVLIGGVFLLVPLDRYLENLQPIIPPFLHLNPLIAVCQLLQMDVFRTPHLYELTPITSYLFVYPSWYIVCGWQVLIGICCFVLSVRVMNY